MKKWLWSILFMLALTAGSMTVVYGYWTSKMDAKVAMTIVHPVDIVVVEDEVPDIDKDIDIDGEVPIENDIATSSNAGEAG